MIMSSEPHTPSKNDKVLFLLLCCGLGAFVLFAILPANYDLPGDLCPAHRILGLNCPGCGLTRSVQALSHGDFGKAFQYNPLIVFVAPYLAYLVVTTFSRVLFLRRFRFPWPSWFIFGFQMGFLILWGILAFVRTGAWLYPESNPTNILLP